MFVVYFLLITTAIVAVSKFQNVHVLSLRDVLHKRWWVLKKEEEGNQLERFLQFTGSVVELKVK